MADSGYCQGGTLAEAPWEGAGEDTTLEVREEKGVGTSERAEILGRDTTPLPRALGEDSPPLPYVAVARSTLLSPPWSRSKASPSQAANSGDLPRGSRRKYLSGTATPIQEASRRWVLVWKAAYEAGGSWDTRASSMA
jgi:hypothetical protein